MAKRRKMYGPGTKGGARRARAAQRRAMREANAKMTSRATGRMGYAKYRGGTKDRSNLPAVVVVNPSNPQQGRIVRVGRRGGTYGQGGSNKSRWGDLSTMTGIVKALPGVAIVTSAAAMGAIMIKNNPTVVSLAKKTPGGNNGLAFIAGGVTMYAAYRYRSLLFFLSGLGLAAYAMIKFGNKEAKLSEYGDGETETNAEQLQAQASAQLPETPTPEVPTPSKLEKASAAFDEADSAFASGDFKKAIGKYEEALGLTNDAIIFFSLGQCYRKIAQSFDDKSNVNAKKAAKNAMFYYTQFINNAKPNDVVDAATLATYKGRAAQFRDSLKGLFFGGSDNADEMPVRGVQIGSQRIAGATLMVSGEQDDDDDDDQVQGSDEEDDYEDDGVGEDDGYDDDDDDIQGNAYSGD